MTNVFMKALKMLEKSNVNDNENSIIASKNHLF